VKQRETVVVTGATKGVGRAVAERFAREQANVALLARGREGLERTAREVQRLGGTPLPLPTDVAEYDAVEAAAAATEEAFGPIDVWVNDAMTTVFAFFEDIEPDEFRRATEVTYLGAVWGTKAALDRMLPRDQGAIVQVGSALAFRGIPLQSPYCGAKHAMKGFFESLRTELLHRGSHVRMSMVQLPGLNTPQFDHCRSKMQHKPMPVPPVYEPEVAAEAVHFAAHSKRRQVFVGVSTAYTILGERLAPALGDWYMAKTGVSSQLAEAQTGPHAGNLFEPVDEGRDARGDYGARAHPRSAVLWMSRHRGALAGAALTGAALAAGLTGAGRSS
jgi:NAD(P)-dependent dehydrogenase (short-subunit alcohol dehydrogenase family)